MPSLPFSAQYTPQEYDKLYCKLDNRLQTEAQSIQLTRTDGGADVTTIVKDYAGRQKGAAMATFTIKAVIPYIMSDASGGGGAGFSSAGIVTGGGLQLDQTMLTGQNQNSNLPVAFQINIGQPAAQKLVCVGFIHQIVIDYADGKQADVTFTGSGSFSVFQ